MKVLSFTNSVVGLLSAVSVLALSSGGALADIVVTDAKIDKGILKVTGTSSTGTQVQLDDLSPVPISATGRKWNYSVVYHPEDCVVDLKVIGAAAPDVQAVVALCGPRGVIPRGAWSATTFYIEDDLVTSGGSSWRALHLLPGNTNNGHTPGIDPNWSLYWEKFAAKGDTGETGPQGPAGADGAEGPAGADGAAGEDGADGAIGPAGPAGADGAAGAQGPQGETGLTGVQGPQGDTGATGAQGPTGATGATGAQGPQGNTGATGAQGPQGASSVLARAFATSPTVTTLPTNVWTTVCSLSLTTQGEPVFISGTQSFFSEFFTPAAGMDINSVNMMYFSIRIVRNGIAVSQPHHTGVIGFNAAPSISTYDTPGAGTHVYAIQASRHNSNSNPLRSSYCDLSAFEFTD